METGGGEETLSTCLSFEVKHCRRTSMFYTACVCSTVLTLGCVLVVLQCHPSGCLTDLFIQMAVIMLLKQTLNNIVEFTVP